MSIRCEVPTIMFNEHCSLPTICRCVVDLVASLMKFLFGWQSAHSMSNSRLTIIISVLGSQFANSKQAACSVDLPSRLLLRDSRHETVWELKNDPFNSKLSLDYLVPV